MHRNLRICAGCGVPLQTGEKERSGYIPPQALERENPICMRCYRIKHYNVLSEAEQTADDHREILAQIAGMDVLVVQVVDVFDLEGSLIDGLPRYIGTNPLLVVANKVDLLPKAINLGHIRNWLFQTFGEWGIRPVDVVPCSVKKNWNMDDVTNKITGHRRGRDVVVVGATNVGKSSLINRLRASYRQEGLEDITTSFYPGTTLGTIPTPLKDGRQMIDTPGIVNNDRLCEIVSPKDVQVITPQTWLHPKIYQLNAAQTLFFAGLARLDFVRGPRQPFVCYFAENLYVHRTKTERAEELYTAHIGGLLSPPSEFGERHSFSKWSFQIRGEKTDIVISGLGWVTCRGDTLDVDLYVLKGVSVSLRPAII